MNGKGGTFLALIARFCTESAKAAYGTNTGIIIVWACNRQRSTSKSVLQGEKKRDTDKAGRKWGQTILVQLFFYKHLITWADSDHRVRFSFFTPGLWVSTCKPLSFQDLTLNQLLVKFISKITQLKECQIAIGSMTCTKYS